MVATEAKVSDLIVPTEAKVSDLIVPTEATDTQIYGSDYYDTFSPVAKMAFIRLLLSMVAMSS